MTWDEVARVHAAGFTIGSHTRTHAILVNETPATVSAELGASRAALESRLGAPVRHFAYPCGQFNAAAVQAVADAGYQYAYTICKHRDMRWLHLTIPRKLLWEKSCVNALGSFSESILSCLVNGSLDFAAPCHLKHREAAPVAAAA